MVLQEIQRSIFSNYFILFFLAIQPIFPTLYTYMSKNDTKFSSIHTEINKNEDGTVTINGTLAWEEFSQQEARAVATFQRNANIDGFRKGKAPEAIIRKHVGDMAILDEMSRALLPDIYLNTVQKNELNVIGMPDIHVTKIARGEDLGFRITSSLMPEITLGDYNAIAKKARKNQEEVTVEKKEIDEAIEQLRKIRHQSALSQKTEDPKDVPSIKDIDLADCPEMDDAYVKELGAFENVGDFTQKLKENMVKEKTDRQREQLRMEIIEKILEDSSVTVPPLLVNAELNKLMSQMEYDISTNGMTMEQYLETVKKTREDIESDMRPNAMKQSKMQLIINRIAQDEKITPNQSLLEKEFEKMEEIYKDHKDFSAERAREYLSIQLLNKAVFDYLEKGEK